MDLAPEMRELLEDQARDVEFARPGTSPMSIDDARAQHEADARRFTPIEVRDVVGEIRDELADGRVPVRIYSPPESGPHATLVWLHGGGWVTGSLETGDIAARALCSRVGVTVVSVEYALAPERPWPAGLDDCLVAFDWVASRLADLGGTDSLWVGGDSAGGNLAALVALQRAGRLDGQVLLYPVVALDETQDAYPSRVGNASGFYVEWADVAWAIDTYIPDAASRGSASPSRSPILADSPRAVIATVEFDPLRDEGAAYAELLRADGVDVELLEFEGLVHGCFDMLGTSPTADAAMDSVAEAIRRGAGVSP